MQVTLRIEGNCVEEDIRSLCEWLLLDRTVPREVRVEMGSSCLAVPGHQGAVLDLVSVVVNSGISAASLGVSIASWRTTRAQEPTITVERADGSKIVIAGTSRDEAQRLIEQLLGDQQQG
ncbi:hypothetical protein [Streptomyces sp. NPDC029004]|uniref:effector-associated constant component EACC1 n=1 Tax=Streptomyces sp. NPDC029004 TaxID=3154490 RepID=UPI0033D3C656